MYVFYSTEDIALQPTGKPHWYYAARLVDCRKQRMGMTNKIRDTVKNFNDQMDDADKSTVVKHYVPYCRISRQLVYNITNFNNDGTARGMTREETVLYLKRVLAGFLDKDKEDFDPPKDVPEDDRMAFDGWVSWAIATICDWPENLFQGKSWGDKQGLTLDVPKIEETGSALQMRLGDAAEKLQRFVKGLNIQHEMNDAPAILYKKYIPGEDEWYMPS